MSFRISQYTMVRQTKQHIAALQSDMTARQRNIATSKRLHAVSDDPIAASQALRINRQLRHINQYSRNLDDAETWLNLTDHVTRNLDDRYTRARDLLIQAGSGALSQAARNAVADELRTLADEITSNLNTEQAGHLLFGGTATTNTPFDETTGQYVGDSNPVRRTVSSAAKLQINLTGEEVAGVYNAGDPANGNIIQVLRQAADDINAGLQVSAAITRVNDLQANLHSAQAKVGSRQRSVETFRNRGLDMEVVLEEERSKAIGTDMAEEMLEVKATEIAYQASIGVASRVLSNSVMDFLR